MESGQGAYPRYAAARTVPEPVTRVIEAAGAWLPARLGEVEARLGELARGYGEALAGSAGATLAAGGKRLRPLLVLICAGAEAAPAALPAAVAVELVHTATLVHDDVLDAAPLRRGRPTVVATDGRDRAVATGDLLFSRAFAELAASGDNRQVALLAEVSVGLALGELAQREDAYDTGVSVERYFERCRLKTARLFESACLLGWANRGGAPGEAVLAEFGNAIGVAFQLLDDVLDVEGPPERTGKARGTDLLDGTVTLPFILAAGADPAIAAAPLRELDPAAAEALCDRIAATGVLEQIRRQALDQVAAAKSSLDAAALDKGDRELLELVADGVVDRYS